MPTIYHMGLDGIITSTEVSTAAQNSLEVSRNGKGDYSWVIKRYDDGNPIETIDKIMETDAELRRRLLNQ